MPSLEAIDQGALPFFAHHRQELVTSVLAGLTHLGDAKVMIPFTALTAAALAWAGWGRAALILLAIGLLSVGISEGTKYRVKRERPSMPPVGTPEASPSFPSGHSLCSTAIYGTLALLLYRRLTTARARSLVFGLGCLLPFVIGFSRMYLGHHYVSDVLGGWSMGLALVLLAGIFDARTSAAV